MTHSAAASTLKVAFDWRLMHEAALPSAGPRSRINRRRRYAPITRTKWARFRPMSMAKPERAGPDRNGLLASGRARTRGRCFSKRLAAEACTMGYGRSDRQPCGCIWASRRGHGRLAERARRAASRLSAKRGSRRPTWPKNDFESARKHYRSALEAKPDLFEALYCLAVLEQDAGDAAAAFDWRRRP